LHRQKKTKKTQKITQFCQFNAVECMTTISDISESVVRMLRVKLWNCDELTQKITTHRSKCVFNADDMKSNFSYNGVVLNSYAKANEPCYMLLLSVERVDNAYRPVVSTASDEHADTEDDDELMIIGGFRVQSLGRLKLWGRGHMASAGSASL